jgi:hypothetical protein
LPSNEEVIVKVTAVDSMDLFYVQLEENCSRLVWVDETAKLSLFENDQHSIAEVEMKLNQSEISPLVVPSIAVGDVCSAKFPFDNK